MALSTASFEFVRVLVGDHSGIVLDEAKQYLIESRLLPIARTEGFDSPDALLDHARRASTLTLRTSIVEAMTTNETSFFRDTEPFEALRQHVIPDLIARRRTSRHLRIWCGAASSGQEPYSVTMLLQEHFPELATWRVEQIATDLSTDVLKKAGAGIYSRLEVNRGLPVAYLTKYFEKRGAEWQIQERVRHAVTFRQMNLVKLWPAMGTFDLVLLRNVMIYFDVATKREILERLHRLLAGDAYLLLGSAETTMAIHDGFERQTWQRTGFYRPLAAAVRRKA